MLTDTEASDFAREHEALRAACTMSEDHARMETETGERDDDADKTVENEFFTASAHGADKTRETYEAWQKAEDKRRTKR
jgi:hypothetical protein